MWQGIGYANGCAIAGLLIHPTLGQLETFGDLLRGEYFDGDNFSCGWGVDCSGLVGMFGFLFG